MIHRTLVFVPTITVHYIGKHTQRSRNHVSRQNEYVSSKLLNRERDEWDNGLARGFAQCNANASLTPHPNFQRNDLPTKQSRHSIPQIDIQWNSVERKPAVRAFTKRIKCRNTWTLFLLGILFSGRCLRFTRNGSRPKWGWFVHSATIFQSLSLILIEWILLMGRRKIDPAVHTIFVDQ
jgi:hypothetical protein